MKLLRTLTWSNRSARYPTPSGQGFKRMLKSFDKRRMNAITFAMQCSDKLKNAFTSVGVFLAERNFIRGDPEGVMKWIEGEIEAFDEVLTGRRDFCAYIGAQGAVSLLEKASYEHAKDV